MQANSPRRRGRKPQFLIEHEGKLYLTRALTEVDPADEALAKADAEQLRSLQERIQQEGDRRAVIYSAGSGDSSVARLLSGTMETRSTMMNFAATEPPVQQ